MRVATRVRQEPPYYLKALVIGIPAIVLGLQISGWIGFLPVIRDGHADFRNLYTAGYMVRSGHGHDLYSYIEQKKFQDELVSKEQVAIPFLRPPFQALVFVPFSLLPFHAAYVLFLLVNLAFIGVCVRMLRPYTKNLSWAWPGLPAAMFLFLPVAAALMQGQDSILLVLVLIATLLAFENGQDLRAGGMLALGLFKFQIVLPVALLFLLWRRFRFWAGFGIASVALGLISLRIVGWSESLFYLHSMLNLSASRHLSSGLPLKVDHMANIHGLLVGLWGGETKVKLLVLGASAILFVIAAHRRRFGSEAFAIAITTSALVSYYLFIHDMSVLIVPIILTLDRALLHTEAGRRTYGRIFGTTLLFVAPAWMAFAPDKFYFVAIPLLVFWGMLMWPSKSEVMAT